MPKHEDDKTRKIVGRVEACAVFAVTMFARDKGLPEDAIDKIVGVPKDDTEGEPATLAVDAPPRLCAALIKACPDSAIPIELASSTMSRFHSEVIYAMRFAPTVGEALRTIARYNELVVEHGALIVDKGSRETSVSWQHPADRLDENVMQAAVGAFHWRVVRDHAVGPARVTQVRLAAEQHGPKSAYEEHFGVLPQFNFSGGYTAYTLPNDCLDLPLRTSSGKLFEYWCQVLETRRETRRHGPSEELIQLRRALRGSVESGDFSITNVAREMNTSVRSAQRVAARHGFQLRSLIEELRLAEAKRLLENPTLSMASVAEALGYSDERAFRRAFQRWTRQSPSQFRRGLRDLSSLSETRWNAMRLGSHPFRSTDG